MLKTIPTLLCALTLLLMASCGHSTKDSKGNVIDKKGIESLGENFAAAWNLHNSQALADLWTSDGDFLSPWTPIDLIKGREGIEKYFSNEYQNTMKNSLIKLDIDNIRMLDPEIAFVEADFTITHMNIAGIEAVPFNDHAVFILVNKDGEWKIQIARPY